MKAVLVLALGNVLAGDDAVAHEIVRAVAADPQVSGCAELVAAGTDLLRQAQLMPGRRRMIIVDAALSDEPAPRVCARAHPLPPSARRAHAHALDPAGGLELLRMLHPSIAAVETWWLLVDVPEISLRPGLSDAAQSVVPAAAAQLRELVLRQG